MSRLLTDVQREQIGLLLSETNIRFNVCRRLKTLLMLDEGVDEARIGVILGASISTVRKWKERFVERGLGGLRDAPRPATPRRVIDPHVSGAEEGSTAIKLVKGQIRVRTLTTPLRISSNMNPVACSTNNQHMSAAIASPVVQTAMGTDGEGRHIAASYLSRRLYLIVTRLHSVLDGDTGASRANAIQQDSRNDPALSVVMEAKSLKQFLNHVDDAGDLYCRYTAHARYLKGPMRLVVEEWVALRGNWDYIVSRPYKSRTAMSQELACEAVES